MHIHVYYISGKDVAPGFWRHKAYADIRRGSLMRWCQMRVQSSKMRVFSFDRYTLHCTYVVPHWLLHVSRGFLAKARLL